MRSLSIHETAQSEISRLKRRDFVTAANAKRSVEIIRRAAAEGALNLEQLGTSHEELETIGNSFH